MKCDVCKIKDAEQNSIVCSDICNKIRLMIIDLCIKYTPTNGCENCLGDLGQGCTQKCKEEFKISTQFIKDMYSLARINLI